MQVRIANRQDEKNIQTLFAEICKKKGESIDLSTMHKDLRNIEANYFGNEGLFLVAEVEGTLIGFAGARKKTDDAISVDRFYIDDAYKRSGIDQEFMRVTIQFAQRMFFKSLYWSVMETPPKTNEVSGQATSSPSCFNKALLVKMKFRRNDNNEYWLPISPSVN